MSFLPIIVLGGAYVVLSGRKKRRRRPSAPKALPSAGRGEVFAGDNPPDIIANPVGARFSLSFPESGGTGYAWKLSASPPDNSVSLVTTEVDAVPAQADAVGGHDSNRVFVFEGAKAGSGSLVFHLQAPWKEGKEPPAKIVEIQTKIS